MRLNANDYENFTHNSNSPIYKQGWLNDTTQRWRRVTKSGAGFFLWNTSKLKYTRVDYKQHHALASHVIPCVKRNQWNVSVMKMHLTRFLTTTFQLTPCVSFLVCTRQHLWRPTKITKCFPGPLSAWQSLEETVMVRPNAQTTKTQFIWNPFHLTQGRKLVHTESKWHFSNIHLSLQWSWILNWLGH